MDISCARPEIIFSEAPRLLMGAPSVRYVIDSIGSVGREAAMFLLVKVSIFVSF